MLFLYYTTWHYTRAPLELIRVWINFLWFILHVFSIPILLKTLFSPFQRLTERYEGGLHLDKLGEVIIVSVLMRLVGFLIRSVVIVVGLVALVTMFALGIVVFIMWFFLPLLIPAMTAFGLAIIFL